MERLLVRLSFRAAHLAALPVKSSLFSAKLICPLCQKRQFQTSASFMRVNKFSKSKKKLTQSKVFSKSQSQKLLRKTNTPLVTVWHKMSVDELMLTLDSDLEAGLKIFGKSRLAAMPDYVIEDFELIKKLVTFYGYRWKLGISEDEVEEDLDAYPRPPASTSDLKKRSPVVTIMGHVDHGKTTLLDALRKTNVVAKEFGGITQHIGAFSVPLPSGDIVTFLDTPGHAAFTAMRARGANATDIIVLVVAADDGVMAQTIESIEHARQAGVPLIVAINKCDKHNIDIDYTVQSLSEHGVYLEHHGGDIQSIEVSALKGHNLDLLLDAINAQAEILELGADPTGLVEGVVVEAHQTPGRGKVATVLVQRGTLEKGAILVAGQSQAKVRTLLNENGKQMKKAIPSTPVEVTGWKELPSAGDLVLQVENERRASEVVTWRKSQKSQEQQEKDGVIIKRKRESHQEAYREWRQQKLKTRSRGSMVVEEEIDDSASLAIVLKADVDGSLEAITDVLSTYDSDQCRLQIVTSGVGDVTESDVELAKTFNGIVYAFNVKSPPAITDIAKTGGVPIHHHNVIYKMIDDLKEELTERLPPSVLEEIIGEANVVQSFQISEGKKKVNVAGCRCTRGLLHRKKSFKLVRDNEIIHEGAVDSLKHFKNEVDSIKTDVECGLKFEEASIQPEPGDTIVCYELKETPQTLHWTLDF